MIASRDKTAVLAQFALFSDISRKSKEILAEICIEKEVDKKEILFTEGQNGHSVYLCVKGHVQLSKMSADGREIVIKVIDPGEVFAEVVLFELSEYPVTAQALTRGLVFVVPKRQFIGLLEREDFRTDFISVLMKKQRYLANRIQFLSTFDIEDRLFLFLKEHYGEKEEIEISLSKKDVAAAIGATPETLSRHLLRLKNEGKMDWQGNRVSIAPEVWGNRTEG
jgi:CRP-like cAMP-binding protein